MLSSALLIWAQRTSATPILTVPISATHLGHADLSHANLSHAILVETVFSNVDLRTTTGLDSCEHQGASILDHRTLMRSGALPLAFLRGCGLPDALIEYLPSLLGEAIQFYSCFISYSTKDRGLAERLHADLQNRGVRCWFAPEDLKIGDTFRQRIDEAIRQHDKLLLLISKHSVESDWFAKRWSHASPDARRNSQCFFRSSLTA